MQTIGMKLKIVPFRLELTQNHSLVFKKVFKENPRFQRFSVELLNILCAI